MAAHQGSRPPRGDVDYGHEQPRHARARDPDTSRRAGSGRPRDLVGFPTDLLRQSTLRQVCHSLSEAQSCGLVHRDIKPANIFLCRYGEEYDFVKVLDFGIVGAVHDPPDGNVMQTRGNAVRGTPAFIAPEQVMGSGVDGRADIYATGCLAYWLLTGQLVFTADNPMGLLLKHAQKPAMPPSTRTEQPIPAALDDLVLSCLAKDPAQRPQSARELSLRLAELEGGGAWTQERAREWWMTHQPAVTI